MNQFLDKSNKLPMKKILNIVLIFATAILLFATFPANSQTTDGTADAANTTAMNDMDDDDDNMDWGWLGLLGLIGLYGLKGKKDDHRTNTGSPLTNR